MKYLSLLLIPFISSCSLLPERDEPEQKQAEDDQATLERAGELLNEAADAYCESNLAFKEDMLNSIIFAATKPRMFYLKCHCVDPECSNLEE